MCLVARPLTGGELSGFLGKWSMKRTTTGILLIFLFFETVCDFFNWVNLSGIWKSQKPESGIGRGTGTGSGTGTGNGNGTGTVM